MAGGKDKRPIVVVRKKKVVGGGHHGGSWKVAYADFVTAMMAFFLVLWIVGMDEQTKRHRLFAAETVRRLTTVCPAFAGPRPVAVFNRVEQDARRIGE